MNPDELQKLQADVAELKLKLAFVKSDRYLFPRDIELMRGKKIRGGIFAGSDTNPPAGWSVSVGSGGSAGQNTVTHNLGIDHNHYSVAVAVKGGTNEAFQVGVANKTTTAFNVYISNGALVQKSFDFIVMLT